MTLQTAEREIGLPPASSGDGACDSTAVGEVLVGCIHDGVHRLSRDVAVLANHGEAFVFDLPILKIRYSFFLPAAKHF